MIYTHVLNRGGRGIISPRDNLSSNGHEDETQSRPPTNGGARISVGVSGGMLSAGNVGVASRHDR